MNYIADQFLLLDFNNNELTEVDNGYVINKCSDKLTALFGKDSKINYDVFLIRLKILYGDYIFGKFKDNMILEKGVKLKKLVDVEKKLCKSDNRLKLFNGNECISNSYEYNGMTLLELKNTDNPYPLPLFGIGSNFKKYVSVDDIYEWGLGRIFPKDRIDSSELLESLGLNLYIPNEILRKTRFHYFDDEFWIKNWRL